MKAFFGKGVGLVAVSAALVTHLAMGVPVTTTWTDGGGDSSWSSASNWDQRVPQTTDSVVIGTQPSGDIIGVDTGLVSNTVNGFAFGAGLTGSVSILNAGVEQLTIQGQLNNASSFNQQFGLFVGLFGSAVTTGQGLLFAGGLEAKGTLAISGAGAFTLGSGVSTVLDLSAATSGRLNSTGSVNYNDTNLVFAIAGTQAAGSSWDVLDAASITGSVNTVSFAGGSYSGELTETTAGIWTGTAGGLSWRFTEADGRLAVVPEPSAPWLLSAGLAALGARRWRRQRGLASDAV